MPLGFVRPLAATRAYTLVLVMWPVGIIAMWLLVELPATLLNVDVLVYSAIFSDEGWGWPWAVLSIAVVPAIFEELAFRGLIQPRLAVQFGPRSAIVATAVMFAIIHLSMFSFVFLALLGGWLCWLRAWSGSVYPGVLAHFLHNATVLALEYAEFTPFAALRSPG